MDSENLAQIGEAYIQSQQEKIPVAEAPTTDEKRGDELDIKALGNLLCKTMNIIFSRVGWEKLKTEEEQSLSDNFIGVIRKRMPTVAIWGSEISFGVIMAVIVLTRIGSLNEVKEYKKGYENENKGISDNSNFRTPRRGKNLFSQRTVKKFK